MSYSGTLTQIVPAANFLILFKNRKFRKEISDHIKVVENNIDAHPNKLVKTTSEAALANFKAKVSKFFPERDDYKDFAENRGATVYDSAQFLGVREASNDDAMRSAVKSIYDDVIAKTKIKNSIRTSFKFYLYINVNLSCRAFV